ncbi:MAG: hypothetical protein M1823_003003 [Watsoniomyces obsoletus]|nr:MAG: hypothetical protein M1823_003003 [Watsoniomyces obsoletus]
MDDESNAEEFPVPETHVLAIASHVVYGYVGNTMATTVMQALGCDVAALNTVQYTYKHHTGSRTPASEIRELYSGLKQNHLNDLDMLLTGYIPTAEAVEAVGDIARDLKLRGKDKPGSFFWALDPVMGDQGRLYVDEAVIPAFKNLLKDADLILPNQFELDGTGDMFSGLMAGRLREAVGGRLKGANMSEGVKGAGKTLEGAEVTKQLKGAGASKGAGNRAVEAGRLKGATERGLEKPKPGIDKASAPETHHQSDDDEIDFDLSKQKSWISPDTHTDATTLPLAIAAEKALGSIQSILIKTKKARDEELKNFLDGETSSGNGIGNEREREIERERLSHLRKTKAAEVRIVRNIEDVKKPMVRYKAVALMMDSV